MSRPSITEPHIYIYFLFSALSTTNYIFHPNLENEGLAEGTDNALRLGMVGTTLQYSPSATHTGITFEMQLERGEGSEGIVHLPAWLWNQTTAFLSKSYHSHKSLPLIGNWRTVSTVADVEGSTFWKTETSVMLQTRQISTQEESEIYSLLQFYSLICCNMGLLVPPLLYQLTESQENISLPYRKGLKF